MTQPTAMLKTLRGALAATLIPLALAGCLSEEYLAHRDLVTSGAGEANAHNAAIQTIDPWPPYARNKTLDNDGRRGVSNMERYQNGAKAPARSSSVTSIADQVTGGASANGSSSATQQ